MAGLTTSVRTSRFSPASPATVASIPRLPVHAVLLHLNKTHVPSPMCIGGMFAPQNLGFTHNPDINFRYWPFFAHGHSSWSHNSTYHEPVDLKGAAAELCRPRRWPADHRLARKPLGQPGNRRLSSSLSRRGLGKRSLVAQGFGPRDGSPRIDSRPGSPTGRYGATWCMGQAPAAMMFPQPRPRRPR